jgi:hypothetical protein
MVAIVAVAGLLSGNMYEHFFREDKPSKEFFTRDLPLYETD